MTIPDGFRAESERTPKASRAGALYATQLYSTPRQVPSLTIANADTREDSLVSVGQVIDAGLRDAGERHPVIRSGERESIPPHIRSAVWYRDHGRCELCSERTINGPWHLDHITPWSAGGSDRTTNLRVLCERHNMERGNKVDPTERPRRAATWWCYRCYGRDVKSWDYTDAGVPVGCPIHTRSEKACPVKRGYRRQIELTGEVPDWHRSHDYIDEDAATVVAFCAHCGIPSLTDVPL